MLKNKLSTLNIARVFIIEPGLRKTCGHPIEYVTALEQYLYSIEIECYIVSNIQIDEITQSEFHNIYPIISQGCFEFEDFSNHFLDDLKKLHSIVELCEHDLVLLTSCFTQEVTAFTYFIKSLPSNKIPRVAFNFHQLYPPKKLFNKLASLDGESYHQYWLQHIQSTFEKLKIDTNYLSFWTSPSKSLSQIYKNLSSYLFQPLPCLFAKQPVLDQVKDSQKKFTFGFLGDGRKEKGLLLLLETIECNFIFNSDVEFRIQNLDARGYSDLESLRFNHLVKNLRKIPNIIFFEQALTVLEFNKLISICDALLLPYEPAEYSARASMLFVQAVINKKPVIVSSQTWMAQEVQDKYASGVIYNHNSFNLTENIKSLSEAMQELKQNYVYFKHEANERSRFYQNWHTPDNYLTKIIDFYDHT